MARLYLTSSSPSPHTQPPLCRVCYSRVSSWSSQVNYKHERKFNISIRRRQQEEVERGGGEKIEVGREKGRVVKGR